MGIADRLKGQYIRRLDELIAAGETMPMQTHSERTSYNYLSGASSYRQYDLARWPDFVEWRTSCIAVLDQIVPSSSLLRKTVGALCTLGNELQKVQFATGFLRSVRREVDAGTLDSLVQRVEAEVLSDYMEQINNVMGGSRGELNHVVAAVMAGVALERCLRTVCLSLEPPELLTTEAGRPLGMTAMIDALKRRQLLNELAAKEARAWAALRNHAAHGEVAEFTRPQVEAMVAGITRFIKEHST